MLLADSDWNLPNALSVLRLALVPVYLWLAFRRSLKGFLIFLAASELLDLIDGPIARAADAITGLGQKLDTWGDFAAYVTLPFAAFWLLRAHFIERTETESVQTTVWSTSPEGPNLETICLGKTRVGLIEKLGDPDTVTADTVFYRHIPFQDKGQQMTTHSVKFTFNGDVVSRLEISD